MIYRIAQRHPNLNLTAEEKRVFYQLFQAADTTNLGVITGEIAVPFFEKTHLPSGTLGEVCIPRDNNKLNVRRLTSRTFLSDLAARG
jgi:hypothetical protein